MLKRCCRDITWRKTSWHLELTSQWAQLKATGSEQFSCWFDDSCFLFPQEAGHFFQGEKDISPYADFINKHIGNASKRFNSFCLGQRLLLLIQNTFLIREIREFSKEVTQTFKWARARSLQLIDLQANAALREHFEAADPATFWLQTVWECVPRSNVAVK